MPGVAAYLTTDPIDITRLRIRFETWKMHAVGSVTCLFLRAVSQGESGAEMNSLSNPTSQPGPRVASPLNSYGGPSPPVGSDPYLNPSNAQALHAKQIELSNMVESESAESALCHNELDVRAQSQAPRERAAHSESSKDAPETRPCVS